MSGQGLVNEWSIIREIDEKSNWIWFDVNDEFQSTDLPTCGTDNVEQDTLADNNFNLHNMPKEESHLFVWGTMILVL